MKYLEETKGKYERLIEKYDFVIKPRREVPETAKSMGYSGKYILLDECDGGEDSFFLVGNDKEKMAKECAGHFDLTR